MDFVKKILHQISRKSEAVSQITFDEDYNVPPPLSTDGTVPL